MEEKKDIENKINLEELLDNLDEGLKKDIASYPLKIKEFNSDIEKIKKDDADNIIMLYPKYIDLVDKGMYYASQAQQVLNRVPEDYESSEDLFDDQFSTDAQFERFINNLSKTIEGLKDIMDKYQKLLK